MHYFFTLLHTKSFNHAWSLEILEWTLCLVPYRKQLILICGTDKIAWEDWWNQTPEAQVKTIYNYFTCQWGWGGGGGGGHKGQWQWVCVRKRDRYQKQSSNPTLQLLVLRRMSWEHVSLQEGRSSVTWPISNTKPIRWHNRIMSAQA